MLSSMRRYLKAALKLHPSILIILLLLSTLAWANLTSHTEALVDSLLIALDADSDGSITDEAWYALLVTNGDSHDHSGGDGAQIDHTGLSNVGTNTHAQVDTHIANTSNPHSVTAAQAGALANVVEDTTPQSGGDYDLNGHVLLDATGVDDDDCTGDQGNFWWDSVDNQWEGCNANSGTPIVLGSGAGSLANVVEDLTPQLGGDLDLNGKVLNDATGIDDDDCTGDQGKAWWDSTDNQWEFCIANSGTPVTLVTNGDSHDHSGGDGAQINHTTLSNIGTNTHAQIDTHIAGNGADHSYIDQDVTTTGNPQHTTVEIGHASDSTLSRVSAGLLAVEGDNLIRASDVDDTPVNGATAVPASSNALYDHENASNPHSIPDSCTWYTSLAALNAVDGSGISAGDCAIVSDAELADSGTTTSTTANKLVQTGQNFTSTVSVGDVVYNTTDTTYTKVTAVDSDTTLSLADDIMTSGENFSIYSNVYNVYVADLGSQSEDSPTIIVPDTNPGDINWVRQQYSKNGSIIITAITEGVVWNDADGTGSLLWAFAFSAARTVTIPGDANVELAGIDTSQTLTNKTINLANNTITSFPCEIGVAASDETTDLTTGTAKVTFRMPYAMTVTEVRANVNTAPVGSTLNVDINESGTTILSTVITIDASEETSESAATPPVISDSSLADDAEITIDIDQIGSSTAGKGLKIWLIGTRSL